MLSVAVCSFAYSPTVSTPYRAVRAASPQMGVSDLPGISVETGGKVWDPLGFTEKMDEGNLKLMRAAELKHGRVAMLACVGWAWTVSGTHFDGLISKSSGVSFAEIAALGPLAGAAKIPAAGIWQMILAIGSLEIFWENKYPSSECAGNFGVPTMTKDPAKLAEFELAELKHGRLAMFGIISFACASALPGSVPLYPYIFGPF